MVSLIWLYKSNLFKKVLFIILFVFNSDLKAIENNDSLYNISRCFEKCLNILPQNRRLFEIAIYNVNREVISNLNQLSINFDGEIISHDNLIPILISNNHIPELAAAKERLIKIYQELSAICHQKSKIDISTQEDLFSWQSYVNGERLFSLQDIFQSAEYKYEIQNIIAKNLNVSIDEVEYNPQTMQFRVRVDKQGRVLPNLESVEKIKYKRELREVTGEVITERQNHIEERSLLPAAMIYEGSINILRTDQNCRAATRNDQIEEYCKNDINTFIKKINVETGEILATTNNSSSFRPAFIAEEVKVATEQGRINANRNQLEGAYSVLSSLLCQNRNELSSSAHQNSPLRFRFPCNNSVDFQFPVSSQYP